MPTDCNASQLEFEGLGSRKVTASFDAGPSPRMRARCCCGKQTAPSACFRDARSQEDIEHTLETLVAQRAHGIALGPE